MHDPVFDIFREEAKEHLGALEKGLLDLESAAATASRRGQIDNLFRHAHSLKGDARAIGLPAMQEAAQQLEDILDALATPEKVTRDVIDRGLKQLDAIQRAFASWQRSVWQDSDAADQFVPPDPLPAEVQPQPTQTSEPSPTQPEATLPTHVVALSEESFTVRVPSERLDRMLSLAGELRIVQRSGDEANQRLVELSRLLSALLDECQRMEHLGDEGLERTDHLGATRESIAGLRARLENCRDQVARVRNSLRKTRNREEILLETLEADIQQARLLPLVMLADSLRRTVRELGQSLGKSIRYEVDVGSVLLDKAVLEALRDPMLHLLRNAASHGIEPAEARRTAGKAAEGTIRVQASRRGNGVHILVADDGRGVDYERIRARVRQTEGLGDPEVAALSKQELARYLFKPGFTTAGTRDAVSGRGVGLDVVLDTVHRLHGSAMLESSSSQGTTFVITVPISISSLRILTVHCQGQFFGIPTALIEKTGLVRLAELRELEGCPILPRNGEPIRWVPLQALLGMPLSSGGKEASPYVLIRQERGQVAVAVDGLEEEAEILLKPLGFPLHNLAGVMGAAVRPDGSVQIVLDLSGATLDLAGADVTSKPREVKPVGRILVVDDSPTTRTILRNVFTAAGYAIRTASDGVDALERLRAEPVDLVVSDVEMPRMDGFELARQVKAQHHVPVILVTGLEKEEHRRKGLEAGADAYVVKSTFQGEGLLEIVKQFV